MTKKNFSASRIDDEQPVSSYIEEHTGMIVELYPNGRKRVRMDFSNDPGVTDPSFLQSCDLEHLISLHVQSGQSFTLPESELVDFTQMPDYQTALNTVIKIDEYFSHLPVSVKQAYDNNPALLMAALDDPSQRDRLIQLGVFKPMEGLTAPSGQEVQKDTKLPAEGGQTP